MASDMRERQRRALQTELLRFQIAQNERSAYRLPAAAYHPPTTNNCHPRRPPHGRRSFCLLLFLWLLSLVALPLVGFSASPEVWSLSEASGVRLTRPQQRRHLTNAAADGPRGISSGRSDVNHGRGDTGSGGHYGRNHSSSTGNSVPLGTRSEASPRHHGNGSTCETESATRVEIRNQGTSRGSSSRRGESAMRKKVRSFLTRLEDRARRRVSNGQIAGHAAQPGKRGQGGSRVAQEIPHPSPRAKRIVRGGGEGVAASARIESETRERRNVRGAIARRRRGGRGAEGQMQGVAQSEGTSSSSFTRTRGEGRRDWRADTGATRSSSSRGLLVGESAKQGEKRTRLSNSVGLPLRTANWQNIWKKRHVWSRASQLSQANSRNQQAVQPRQQIHSSRSTGIPVTRPRQYTKTTRASATTSGIAEIASVTARASAVTATPTATVVNSIFSTPAATSGSSARSYPCTSYESAPIIDVVTASDFSKRLLYSNRTTVILELKADITLSVGLQLNASFSCTILRSARNTSASALPPSLLGWSGLSTTAPTLTVTGYTLSLAKTDEPVLRVLNTNNVIIHGVSFVQTNISATSAWCSKLSEVGVGVICPAVHIYKSYHVQLAKGAVFGRVDVYRAMSSRIDSMKVTGISTFAKSPGAIRVAFCGHGPSLQPSYVAVTNNDVYGVNTPIVIYNGAVGVTVRNNYVHHFIFTGIRCGADAHNQGDCMLSTISNNLVVAQGRNMSGGYDAAGIYFCTHWYNPGNVAECNYIYNGDHCYYVDFVSSGVIIKGGACINTYDGMKVNNGKNNIIEDVIMKNVTASPGWYACLTATTYNSLKDPGSFWENMRRKYYDSSAINTQWPWMATLATETAVNGISCNNASTLPAPRTGACSGFPTANKLDLVLADSKKPLTTKVCENFTTVDVLNSMAIVNITSALTAGFTDYAKDDLSVTPQSVILKSRPKFRSCPRSQVGPKRVPDMFYYKNFNCPEPYGFQSVLKMGVLHIHDLPYWP